MGIYNLTYDALQVLGPQGVWQWSLLFIAFPLYYNHRLTSKEYNVYCSCIYACDSSLSPEDNSRPAVLSSWHMERPCRQNRVREGEFDITSSALCQLFLHLDEFAKQHIGENLNSTYLSWHMKKERGKNNSIIKVCILPTYCNTSQSLPSSLANVRILTYSNL